MDIKPTKIITSLGIILAALGISYAPIPGFKKTIFVVSGSELQEPLKKLEARFEEQNKNINLEIKIQGSQDMVNNYIDRKNDFQPTVLIPANGEKLTELRSRWLAQNQNEEPFYDQPTPIAKTMLVAIAWPERSKILFPQGRFQWKTVEMAMEKRSWGAIGGKSNWGSFDFIATDPTRSNSGQLTVSLWSRSRLGGKNIDPTSLNNPGIVSLFSLIKRSIYQPPRSTDILLEEFITRGPNDADVATVYESIALYRWSQAKITQGKPYQIYYLNPTIETVSTAAIVRRDVDKSTAEAARKFLDFLNSPQQQEVFVEFGFRPVVSGIDLRSVPKSPWGQNIPGAQINPSIKTVESPDARVTAEIQRLWQRVK